MKKMNPRYLLLLLALLVLISACDTGPKTQPIIVEEEKESEPAAETDVTDVTGAVTQETPKNDSVELNKTDENTKTIIIEDIKFKPDKITIPAGTTVIWKHQDKYLGNENIMHIVMVYPIAKRSEKMAYGGMFNVTFDEPGKYYYIDIIFKENMRGDIIVE